MKVLLLNPPVSDPTCRYSSLYHLKSYITHKSTHQVFVKDINIEWLDYLIKENYTDRFQEQVKQFRKTFESKCKISTYEAVWYHKLISPKTINWLASVVVPMDILTTLSIGIQNHLKRIK